MSKLSRFSVSLDSELTRKFDAQIKKQGYPTRSKAVADLIRDSLVRQEWNSNREVAAVITLIYDHHKRDLQKKLTHLQHEFYQSVISTQHIHLDHDNCLEIIVCKGRPKQVKSLGDRLRAIKGVKFASTTAASTGKAL